MSADLMMAALADEAMSDTDGDDGSHKDHTDCDEMPGCVAAVSHKVAAVSHVMHAECGAAVSQEECALVAKTFSVENKKRQSDVKHAGNTAKKCKVEPAFVQAANIDGMHQCLFVDGECIPLWPQYLHKTAEGRFIRVDRMEAWLIQFMVASRRHAVRGREPGEKNKTFARSLVRSVCDNLLNEFRRLVLQRNKERHQGMLTIRMNDCEVFASAFARHFYILLDERAMIWIKKGLRRAVAEYFDAELLAVSHKAMKPDCDQFDSMVNMRAGVRDKVYWVPEKCKWCLRFKDANGVWSSDDRNYCKDHDKSLEIPTHLKDGDFKNARELAFRDACHVWNAIDKSGRRRIQLPEKVLNVSMVPVLTTSDPDSEAELERSDERSECDEL